MQDKNRRNRRENSCLLVRIAISLKSLWTNRRCNPQVSLNPCRTTSSANKLCRKLHPGAPQQLPNRTNKRNVWLSRDLPKTVTTLSNNRCTASTALQLNNSLSHSHSNSNNTRLMCISFRQQLSILISTHRHFHSMLQIRTSRLKWIWTANRCKCSPKTGQLEAHHNPWCRKNRPSSEIWCKHLPLQTNKHLGPDLKCLSLSEKCHCKLIKELKLNTLTILIEFVVTMRTWSKLFWKKRRLWSLSIVSTSTTSWTS